MRIENIARALTVPEALLIYFAVLFFWHFILSSLPPEFDHVDFLKYSAATVTIYWIAKTSADAEFWGRRLKSTDTADLGLLLAATVLTGVGCGALLVHLDAVANGDFAAERWGLISHQEFAQLQWSVPWLIGHFFTSSLLAPIAEEIVFRGFILKRLRERYSTVIAVLASAALFGALHFNKSFLGAFVHGLIFAVMVVRMSSIYPAIVVHCLYNAAVFALMTLFGVSMIADAAMISRFTYWAPEFLCGLAGLVISVGYFVFWPFGRDRKTLGQCDSNIGAEV